MGFADDQFDKYLQQNQGLLRNITIDEILPHMAPCLSLATIEKLKAYVRNQGNRKTVLDFYLDLTRGDNWPHYFLKALRECKHDELATKLEEVYASFQLPESRQSGPLSLPLSLSQHNHQPTQEGPQRSFSLPGRMPPTSLDTQSGLSPKPSQRLNQIQPEQEMMQSSPSQHNHEFRSLPPFPQDPPAPPRSPLSHNVSEPIHSDRRTVDHTSRNPVPETTPYQSAVPEGDVEALQKDESSVSENPHVGPDPLPSHKLSPNLKGPPPEVSIKPSSQNVSPTKLPEIRTTLSYSPSTSSDGGADIGRGQPAHDETEQLPAQVPAYIPVKSIQKEHRGNEEQREQSATRKAANHPEQPESASYVRSVKEKVVQGNRHSAHQATEQLPAQVPAYIPVKSIQKENRGNEEQREQSATRKASNHPEQPESASHVRSVKEKVVQGNRHSAHQAEDNVPDRRPANRETVQGEPSRGRPADQQVPSGSSCRPLDSNNEEEYLSKPGILESTLQFADITVVDGASSEMSHSHDLQISDSTEGNESSNASGRSSPPSNKQQKVPPSSSPNNMLIKDRHPEENNFTFDSRSSPGRNSRLAYFLSKQPEENSFGSSDVRHHRLHFGESPEKDLMGSNDDTLRNRPRKSPNTSEPNDQKTQQKYSKKPEGRDLERTILITITAASLCLSLYLLWKIRQN